MDLPGVKQGLSALVRATVEPLLDPGSRLFLPVLLLTVVLVALLGRLRVPGAGPWWRVAGSWLDLRRVGVRVDVGLLLVSQWMGLGAVVAALVPVAGLSLGVRDAVSAFGIEPGWLALPSWLAVPAYSLLLFVAWDLSRFLLHYALHRVPILWRFHQVHHSAAELTPWTFHRVHPVEVALSTIRGVWVTGGLSGLALHAFGAHVAPLQILAVDAIGLLFNTLGGNLRHSHVRWSWAGLERSLLSPAQHQIHHEGVDGGPVHNYGTWLAWWDRMAGSWAPSEPLREPRFGLPDSELNHEPESVFSALVDPFRPRRTERPTDLARGGVPILVAALACMPIVATAEESDGGTDTGEARSGEGSPGPDAQEEAGEETPTPTPSPEPDRPASGEMGPRGTLLVIGEKARLPRVAGSAHRVGEEELEVFERNDIQRVLEAVPGVQARTEDGYGLRPNIGLRGAASDRSAKVMLLQDGLPLAPAPYAAPAAYYFPLPARIVGVEVWKGASSIRHGPQTVAGAIDVHTRPVPEGGLVLGDLALGFEPDWKLHAGAGFGGTQVGFWVEYAHLGADGWKDLDGGGPTGFSRDDLVGKVRFRAPTLGTWVEVQGGWGRERSFETYLGLSKLDAAETPNRRYAASQRSEMRWNHGEVAVRWGYDGPRGFTLDGAAWWSGLDRAWTKVNGFAEGPDLHALLTSDGSGGAGLWMALLRGEVDGSGPGQDLVLGTNDRAFHSHGATLRLRHVHKPREGLSSEFEAGVRVILDRVRRTHDERRFRMVGGTLVPTGDPAAITLDRRAEALGVSIFAHEELAIGPVHLLPGLRVELVHTEEHEATAGPGAGRWSGGVLPGFGVLVAPRPFLQLYGGVHRGFSPVSPGQPDDVRPEGSWSSELGARLAIKDTAAEVTGFLNHYDNLLGQCSVAAGCGDERSDRQWNGGAALAAGVEVVARQSIRLPHQLALHLHGSYTFTRTAFLSNFHSEHPLWGSIKAGDELPYQPRHRVHASLGFDFRYGRATVAVFALDAQRDVPGQGAIADRARVPGSATVDLSGEARILPWLGLYLSVENLGNQRAVQSLRPFGARPGRPIHASIGVRGTWGAPPVPAK